MLFVTRKAEFKALVERTTSVKLDASIRKSLGSIGRHRSYHPYQHLLGRQGVQLRRQILKLPFNDLALSALALRGRGHRVLRDRGGDSFPVKLVSGEDMGVPFLMSVALECYLQLPATSLGLLDACQPWFHTSTCSLSISR